MTSRRLLVPLALVTALTAVGCTDNSGDPDATPSPSPTVSVRPTLAAPVPGGFVSAEFDATSDVKVDQLIARLNALPGVLGAGFFAGELRITIRLKPDATKAQIDAVVAAVRKERALSDVVFEPPDATAPPASPRAPAPSPTRKTSPSPTPTTY